MNPSMSFIRRPLTTALALPLLALALAACDVGSTDSTTAVVSDDDGTIYNFSGLYLPENDNEYLVYPTNRQSGTKLTWIRLLQYGSVLEAYDNAGKTWDGSISTITEGNASFTLEGSTTAGAAVNIAGTLRYANQSSTMDAAWIEPSFSGSIFAQATVASPATNAPNASLQITPESTTQFSREFVASGGSGSYTWRVSDTAIGTVSPNTGSRVTYTSTGVLGTNTITVTDSGGNTATARAIYIP